MKNTKNFILVGATLLFSAISTCGFAQIENKQQNPIENKQQNPLENKKQNYPNIPFEEETVEEQVPAPTPESKNTLQMDMNNLRQQWDSLYLTKTGVDAPAKTGVDVLAKTYTEVAFVRKLDGSIKAKTRVNIQNSFEQIKYKSYSSQQTDAVLESDGTIRVTGTFDGLATTNKIWERPIDIQIWGTYDRNVILVDGEYKIFKSNDIQYRWNSETGQLRSNVKPSEEPNIDPTPLESNTLQMDMNNLRQQWDSLYLANDANNLAKAYTEVVIVRKLDGSIKAKTRAQILNSFNNKFAKIKTLSYSSQQTDAVMESDGTIRVRGTFVGMVDRIGKNSDPIQISGTYDRNVIYVNGKYKICKHNDIVN